METVFALGETDPKAEIIKRWLERRGVTTNSEDWCWITVSGSESAILDPELEQTGLHDQGWIEGQRALVRFADRTSNWTCNWTPNTESKPMSEQLTKERRKEIKRSFKPAFRALSEFQARVHAKTRYLGGLFESHKYSQEDLRRMTEFPDKVDAVLGKISSDLDYWQKSGRLTQDERFEYHKRANRVISHLEEIRGEIEDRQATFVDSVAAVFRKVARIITDRVPFLRDIWNMAHHILRLSSNNPEPTRRLLTS